MGVETPNKKPKTTPHQRAVERERRRQAKEDKAYRRLFDRGAPMKMAANIINKFGGIIPLSKALAQLHEISGDDKDKQYIRAPRTIRHWYVPKRFKGMDGMIPHQLWPAILRAARYQGIVLTIQDFVPELFEGLDGIHQAYKAPRRGRTQANTTPKGSA